MFALCVMVIAWSSTVNHLAVSCVLYGGIYTETYMKNTAKGGLKLSQTSKMPCPSFALPAGDKCLTGRRLMIIPGSVCKSCYARKGFGVFPAPAAVRLENYKITLASLHGKASQNRWVDLMVALIKGTKNAWFRWHDSGDLLSAHHLRMIYAVCAQTPDVAHWLPTREYAFVKLVVQSKDTPSNLTIRLSAHMVGDVLHLPHGITSSVGSESGYKCPATYSKETDGKCGTCRACWDKGVQNVDYKKH